MDTNGVQVMEADLLDHHTLHEAMEGVDTVYNLASPMPDSDVDFERVNTEGTQNLLEVASETKAKNFVHLSTLDVYGFSAGKVSPSSPLNPAEGYQKSKADSERVLTDFSKRNPLPRITIIRAAKSIGSRDESIMVPLLRSLKSGRVSVPGEEVTSFTHPLDVAQAMYKAALGSTPTGSLYLIKSFDSTPQALALSLAQAAGLKADIKKQGLFGGGPFSRYGAEQLKAGLTVDVQENWGEIGYSPQFDLKGTVAEVARWFEKEPWVIDAD